MAVPRVDLDLDLEAGLVVAVPGDGHEALGVLAQGGDVRAVVAVDRDAAAERDIAEDRVAGHGPAALREPERDVADALDADAELGRVAVRAAQGGGLAAAEQQVVARAGVLDARLALLEPLQ